MEVTQDGIIPHNSGRSFIVKKGQRIRVLGETTCDLVVFNYDNLWERFDQARTKANQVKVYLTTGDILYSKINGVMMTIVEDTYKGRHDLQYGMCSKTTRDEHWRRRDTPEPPVLARTGGARRGEPPQPGPIPPEPARCPQSPRSQGKTTAALSGRGDPRNPVSSHLETQSP